MQMSQDGVGRSIWCIVKVYLKFEVPIVHSSSSLSTLSIRYKGHPTKRLCICNSFVNFQIRSESDRCDRRAHRFGRDRQESGVEERRSRGKEEDHHRSHTGTK